jgi:hypothetical protein
MNMKRNLPFVLTAIIEVLLIGCTPPAPKWLLIEYPDKINKAIMRFPGVRADSLQECLRQSGEVLKMRLASAVPYSGAMQCGSDCHFSVEVGSPVCEELVDTK